MMKYNFFTQDNSLIITDKQRVILSGIKIRINYTRSKNVLYVPHSVKLNGNTATVDKAVKGTFKLRDIPDTADRYLVHDYFEDKYFILDKEGEVKLETAYNTCKLLSLYPISDDETAVIGNGSYYTEAADPSPKNVSVKDFVKP